MRYFDKYNECQVATRASSDRVIDSACQQFLVGCRGVAWDGGYRGGCPERKPLFDVKCVRGCVGLDISPRDNGFAILALPRALVAITLGLIITLRHW